MKKKAVVVLYLVVIFTFFLFVQVAYDITHGLVGNNVFKIAGMK